MKFFEHRCFGNL